MLPQPEFIAAPHSAPSVVSRKGMLQVFWISRDGSVITQFWPQKGKWSLPEILVPGDSPLAAVPEPGLINFVGCHAGPMSRPCH
ncbi:MAG TPA: hypothetical protein VGD71_31080 [Kribbella sp.]